MNIRNKWLVGALAALGIGGGIVWQGTEPDREYQWSSQQAPIEGYDLSRGYAGRDPKNLSVIEDSVLEDGVLRYTNPRIRFRFFSEEDKTALVGRWTADTGLPVQVHPQNNFDTLGLYGPKRDPLVRVAYYLDIPDAGIKDLPLERLRYLTLGKDKNGKQLYSSWWYVLAVDGPGKFFCDPIPDAPEGTPSCEPGFVPATRVDQ